ncbi:MAG: HD domain-containing protein [Anaerolineales bacterium]|nr:HD domain-containing protein [Anaerolineales bacterium]
MNREQIEQIARSVMLDCKTHKEREPGWIFYHGLRTARIAEDICSLLDLNIDGDVLFTGALFHDIGKGSKPHNIVGAELTGKLLGTHFDEEELDRICEIVRLHNQRNNGHEYSLEVRVVQDADLLDHVGPINSWLAFYWSGTHNETIEDHVSFITSEETEQERERLRSQLNFDVSVRMYDERILWEDRFFETFRNVYFEGVWHSAE